MLCYKDKTFCNFDCKNKENCNSWFTKTDKQNSKKLNLPVSFFVDKPDCFKKKD